jgi:hypothetical protein
MALINRPLSVFGLATLLSMPALASAADSPPEELFAPAGTVLTVQLQDQLSSDKNRSGDSFVAMLKQPLVIDGWVVAREGQTVMGQITSSNGDQRERGKSNLGLELTEIVLVDGHQSPIHTELLQNYGKGSGNSHDNDAATIAGVGVIGTVIGAAVGGGKGALLGAGIGVGAATAGVLTARGKPVEIYPESTLTFRLETPLVVSTVHSQQAFLPVAPDDYDKTPALKSPPPRRDPDGRSYEPVYDRYPRFPAGRVVAVGPPIVLLPPVVPIVIDRGHWRRW